MELIIYKIIGALGLVGITVGIWLKNEITQDILFILGGLFLLIYSISLRDPIFIPLQIIFTLSAGIELYKLKTKK